MRYHESLWNEEQENRKKPQHNMGRACSYRRAEELGDDYDQDLCQRQVGQAQLSAQNGTVRCDLSFGRLQASDVRR
jgi:hypothetical protein